MKVEFHNLVELIWIIPAIVAIVTGLAVIIQYPVPWIRYVSLLASVGVIGVGMFMLLPLMKRE